MAGHPLAGGATLALATLPYAISRFSKWQHRRGGSPVAYLLSAERELAGR
jgi:hypothetical protein